MKKLLVLILIFVMVGAVALTGCGGNDQPTEPVDNGQTEEPMEAMYEDGYYFARGMDFSPNSGWKEFVVVMVEDGMITDAYWSATHVQGKGDKDIASRNGGYPMVEFGGAVADWHVQAEAAEAWLIENQDPMFPEDLYIDEDGHTDALMTDADATVSIHVDSFFDLANKAIMAGPVPAGQYMATDYVMTASLPEDDNGNVYLAEFTIVNGTIMDVNLNAITATTDDDGNMLSKKELGDDYGMKEKAGSEYEWYEQAASIEDFILETQGIDLAFNDEGKTDAIAGVSITVSPFANLFEMALGK